MKTEHRKVRLGSPVLGREFHFDEFLGAEPKGVLFILGGSGQTRSNYLGRAKTVHPQLREFFAHSPLQGMNCIYVTAPFDIPFARPELFEARRGQWNAHLTQEVFPYCKQLPIYLLGYSGGLILAVSGAHEDSRVCGVGGLGADGIPEDFEPPYDASGSVCWQLSLRYGARDPVRAFNQAVYQELVDAGQARVIVENSGGHDFSSYLRNGAFGRAVAEARRACEGVRPDSGNEEV